jgi:hypothetical protein
MSKLIVNFSVVTVDHFVLGVVSLSKAVESFSWFVWILEVCLEPLSICIEPKVNVIMCLQ